MLHIVRNNTPYTVIILFVFTLIVKFQALSHPLAPVALPEQGFYSFVLSICNIIIRGSAFGYTMLAVVMLFAQALYLNGIAIRNKLYAKPTYIIAYLYILLSSLAPSLSYFSVALLINWCLIAAIDLLFRFHQTTQPQKHIFNTGFILSIAGVLHFPAIIYVLLLFITLLLLRSFNLGEWIVAMLGYLTPIYFFAGVLFIADQFPVFQHWPVISFYQPEKARSLLYMIGTVTGILTLFICGFVVLQTQLSKISVFMRRNWIITLSCLLVSILISIASPVSVPAIWLLLMPALSLIISHAFYLEKSKVFSNFVFYFSLLLILFCQLTFK